MHALLKSGTNGTQPGLELHTEDCAFVLTDDTNLVWQSNAPNSTMDCRMLLQEDGKLIIYDVDDKLVWSSNTNSIHLVRLDDDGKLRGYDAGSTVVWVSHFTNEELKTALLSIDRIQQPTLANLNGVSVDTGVELQTDDCMLVLTNITNNNEVLWRSNAPDPALYCRIQLQDDGNVVIIDGQDDSIVWASNTNSIHLVRLDDDGKLRGYDAGSTVVWVSHSVLHSNNVDNNIQQQSTSQGIQLQTDDCALVLIDTNNNNEVVWQSNAPDPALECSIQLQDDGNVVISNVEDNSVVWVSNTKSIKFLRLDEDGILRGYDADATAVVDWGRGSRAVQRAVWFSHFPASELDGFAHDAQESMRRAIHFQHHKDQATPRFLPEIGRINTNQPYEVAMGWRRIITCHGTTANVTYVHVYKSGGSAAEQLTSTGCQQAIVRENMEMPNDLNFGTVSGTIATFVRDPIDRFYSAVAEIYAAGLDNPADHDRWNPDPNAPQTWVGQRDG